MTTRRTRHNTCTTLLLLLFFLFGVASGSSDVDVDSIDPSSASSSSLASPPVTSSAFNGVAGPLLRAIELNDRLTFERVRSRSSNNCTTGDSNHDDMFTPDQPLPPDWDLTVVSSSGTSSSDDIDFRVPISRRLGMWSFQCCPNCSLECGGSFVQQVCLNRTTEEPINSFACSRIPSIPLDSYIEWAMNNCSLANCPTWNWTNDYKTPVLTCGISYAWPQVTCVLENQTLADSACWPQRQPEPIAVTQATCGNSIQLLPFQSAASTAPFEARQFADIAASNMTLYLVGGLTRRNAANHDLRADVWKSTTFGSDWEEVPVQTAAFTAIQDHTVEVLSGSLIVIGGQQHNVPSENVWRSDDGGAHWYVCGYLSRGRAQHDSTTFLNGIVIVGGFTTAAVKNDVLWTSDASHFYLQTAAAPWAPRTYPSIDVVGNQLVLVGGWLQSGVAAVDVWKTYDMVSWFRVMAATPWTPRVGFVFYSTHRTLHIVGGISETGGIYHQDQWVSGDVGLTWQLRSPYAPVAEGSTQPRPLSRRSWSAYAKMTGDRLFVLGGEYQGELLNDVWLGDRSVISMSTDIVTDDTDVDSVGPPSSFVAIVVCLSSGGFFLLCVTFIVCRHRHAKRLLEDQEEQASSSKQHEEEVALQQIILRDPSLSPVAELQHHQEEGSSGGDIDLTRASAVLRGLEPQIPYEIKHHHKDGVLSPHRSSASSSASSMSGRIGISGGGIAPGTVKGSVGESSHHSQCGGGASSARSRNSSIPSPRTRATATAASVAGVATHHSSGGPVPSAVRSHRGSSTRSRRQSSVSTPLTPRRSPFQEDPSSQIASSSGGGASSPIQYSSIPSSSVHIHPLLVANGAVSPLSPPPFPVDPTHLAWMQAQISYQASLLAAVSLAQGNGNSSSSSPQPSISGPSGCSSIPPSGEEYFRSVPQLASQQAQLLYVQSPGNGVVLSHGASSSPPPSEHEHGETNEGEEEFQPGQQEPIASIQTEQPHSTPTVDHLHAHSRDGPSGESTDSSDGTYESASSDMTMTGVTAASSSSSQVIRIPLTAIQEGESEEGAPTTP